MMKVLGRSAAVVAILACVIIGGSRWANEAMTEAPPTPEGNPTTLRACPESPNCVSTMAESEQHKIAPISVREDAEVVMGRVQQVVEKMGGRVTDQKLLYLQAEYTTPILRFIDDVEFIYDEASGTLHFRSASRVGHSDLGVNRKRMERFRSLFVAANSENPAEQL